ncbi:aminopeptidase N-like isoform X1 [Galleria mellonella]|uniref:Aminopeptidase N-like isoform X1 n=1 Tax=Galleria mellonella TaxID=7137 RepID=A0A6J1WL78_GALME|nr:aminopeptidase N-like isoform X1 [Galleria mellonella]XP_026755316.2 aminopeptidase N-like isoform X1 [Galleria mellonella]XP_026755317.2 aminopeptidase N-like isoform X1 [Galleria mellonella]
MTLSNSRQQFLAYESQGADDIQYGRKGGMFVSTCVCISFIILSVIVAILVGVIVYFITYFRISQGKTTEFWDETEPFGQASSPSPDLRLPSVVVPSFYRLKLITDLEHSNFSGEVYITIRASQRVKEIILHSKNLSINKDAKLTEQIYEKFDILHSKSKREVNENVTIPLENNVTNTAIENITEIVDTKNETIENGTIATKTPDPVEPEIIRTPETTLLTPVDTQITHSTVRNIKILSITEGTGDRLILTLASALTPDVDYTLQLSFKGDISNSLTGFYKSTYTNSQQEVKKLGVTQFEPTSARAAFPCFDEPAFKAKFEISIAHPTNITALSNMKVATEEAIPDRPGWQWTHFDRSVNMSTYLVAYVLSDFKSLETSYVSKDNITKPIRVWTRPELIDNAKYAINITPRLLDYYEDLFGVPYALDKLDLIAIPDFSSGAMENWGLITFRETTLLFDEKEGVPRDRQNVAIDIAHELAHQWFGNLVTMRWWTDLWLNEGFATYVEYVGVDHIEPNWNMLETLTRDKMDLLRSDALKNTSPVSRKVIDASEISQKFDEISYTKGSNLIRMLNHTISEDLFHKGLMLYLNNWKYTNAEENDLWESMSEAAAGLPEFEKLSLVQFMNSWTRQAGYPVVNVLRNYDTGEVEFQQKLFTSTKEPYQSMVDQLWHIPISYATLSEDGRSDDWTAKPKIWLNNRTKTFTLPINQSQALYVNVDAVGYYRVNYDKRNWELLNKALKSGHVNSPIAKAQLIDDAFNLAKASQLNYSYALGLTTCVIDGEDSKIVWDLLLNNMGFLRHNLKATSGYIYFQDYMRLILKTQLERLNYGLDKPKNDNEAFLIENLVMWECYVESPRCLQWAKNEFSKWVNGTDINNNPIPSYLRSLVYNIVLKHGGREEFEFLWNVFLNSSDPTVKSIIINNLPSTNNEGLITMLLEKSLTEIPKQYAIAAWSVEAPAGTRRAQALLRRHFRRVRARFASLDPFMLPAALSGAFGFIASADELHQLKSFAMEHKEELLPMSQTLQKLIDTATLRIDWIERYSADINRWFQDYVTNKLTASPVNEPTTPASNTPNNTTGGLNITEVILNSTNVPIANPPNAMPVNHTSL